MKISVTLDLGKIDKSRIQTRSFRNKQGQEITAKEYKIDVIELKEAQTLKEGDGWTLKKTHFVVNSPTKEERANKTKTGIIGDGIQFVTDDVTPDDIPF